jgi:predicted aconitase
LFSAAASLPNENGALPFVRSKTLNLTDEERAMRAGGLGPAVQWAIEHQIRVGRYLGARDFVPVSQAHIMADTESLGEAGVAWLERWASLPFEQRRVRIPTITDPRGTDFAAAHRLKQQPWMLELERRASDAFEALGVLMTNTCINYQTIMPPVRGEHVAYGDTGVVIYSNSVCGARSNFEGGPSALSAGLTGRTPRYGYHLDERRRATLTVRVTWTPRALNDWGALGGIVGRLAGDYWQVPAFIGIDRIPGSDEMKHFGAALASFGSVALFHMAGITPEAQRLEDILPRGNAVRTHDIGEADIRAFHAAYTKDIDTVDVVVFSAPQLSLVEMQQLADLLDGRRAGIPLLAVTSPQVKPDADRLGLTARIESAGGIVLSGMCFYQSYAREIAEANGWKRLATNSAKLTNIIGGYGYEPALLSMEACIEAACAGGRISQ